MSFRDVNTIIFRLYLVDIVNLTESSSFTPFIEFDFH